MTDHDLLRKFVLEGSSEAFTDLVRRHLGLVLASARRQLAAPHLAEDVAQRVFSLLVVKAARLSPKVILSGWLYRTTCRMTKEVNRTERRRQQREQAAISIMTEPAPQEIWQQIAPILDQAMATLPERDRDAVVMRYFENKTLREVGAALGATEDAAQKRLARAMDRLRQRLAQHGHELGVAALTTAIAAGAAESVSPAAAATFSSVVLASATPAGIGAVTLFTMTQIKPILLGGTALAAAAGLLIQQQRVSNLQADNLRLRAQMDEAAKPVFAPPPAVTDSRVDPELLKLRGEVARLRPMEAELARMKKQVAQLQAKPVAATEVRGDGNETSEAGVRNLAEILNLRMQYAKQLVLGIHNYAAKNNGQLPRTLQLAAQELGEAGPEDSATSGQWFGRPSSNQFELLQQGALADIQNPSQTILIRERLESCMRIPDGSLARSYGFADGHSELTRSANGDFTEWEKEHSAH